MRQRLARLHDAHNGRLDLVRAIFLDLGGSARTRQRDAQRTGRRTHDLGARLRQLRRLFLLRSDAADANLVELGPKLGVETAFVRFAFAFRFASFRIDHNTTYEKVESSVGADLSPSLTMTGVFGLASAVRLRSTSRDCSRR